MYATVVAFPDEKSAAAFLAEAEKLCPCQTRIEVVCKDNLNKAASYGVRETVKELKELAEKHGGAMRRADQDE
jgi:hypothetical protein